MHLLMAFAVTLMLGACFDRSRIIEKGFLFVLRDYIGQISRRLMVRRILYTIGIMLFVLAAWQVVGFDWAFVALGCDVMLYLEIISMVYLVATRGRIYQIAGAFRPVIEIGKKITSTRLSRVRRTRRHANDLHEDENDNPEDPPMAFAFAKVFMAWNVC